VCDETGCDDATPSTGLVDISPVAAIGSVVARRGWAGLEPTRDATESQAAQTAVAAGCYWLLIGVLSVELCAPRATLRCCSPFAFTSLSFLLQTF
jgi:hypothetical protein